MKNYYDFFIFLVVFIGVNLLYFKNVRYVKWLKDFPMPPDGHPSGKIMPGLIIVLGIQSLVLVPLYILSR